MRLRYVEAAGHFAAAAGRVPAGHEAVRLGYLERQAGALYRRGDEFGDTGAFEEAIGLYRRIAAGRPREQDLPGWVRARVDLGDALAGLGERKSGTEHLEQAVEAYRAALEVRPREWASPGWSETEANLGNALAMLGEREAGTEYLTQAVEAFRAALLGNHPRAGPARLVPTQGNLGNALTSLGGAGGPGRHGSSRRSRPTGPRSRSWTPGTGPAALGSQTEMSLGNALTSLGAEREAGTGHLEAVEAYEAALGELTRERDPVGWARTQMNLALALASRGKRESASGRSTGSAACSCPA